MFQGQKELDAVDISEGDMTNEQYEILQRALGLNRYKKSYRNHFVTGPGSTDYQHCEALVSAGLMTKWADNGLNGGDYIYSVTAAGLAAMKEYERG